jgi:site-specific DNA recombinase
MVPRQGPLPPTLARRVEHLRALEAPNPGEERVQLEAAAYLRCSGIGQQIYGQSLTDQDRAVRGHCARHGHTLPDQRIFREAVSGTRSDRAAFWDLIKCIDTGQVQVLVAWDLFRAGSNDQDAALLAMKCREHKVRIEIVSTQGSYVLDNPESKLQYRVMAAFSDYRRENILLTFDRGKKFRGLDGYWVTGSAPFGYKADGSRGRKRLVPDQHAQLVAEVYERFNRGDSSASICRWLCSLQLTKRLAGKDKPFRWRVPSIAKIIDNPAYVGYLAWDDQIVPGLHQPLVTPEVWEAAQARRAEQRAKHPGRKPREPAS